MQNTLYLLQCRSLTYAQRSARILEHAGITGTVTRLPKSVADRGCGYGVIVTPGNIKKAMDVLRNAGLSPKRVFIKEPDESIREAADDLS